MLNLIPTPKKQTVINEEYHVISHAAYTAVADWQDIMDTFCDSISRIYEIDMARGGQSGVSLVLDPTLDKAAYVLDSREGIVIRASAREGALYGLATALQLLETKNGSLVAPGVLVEDRPDKDYRSFMIATGRIFHPFKKMLKYVDLCFYYKLKYLHLHLADADLYSLPSRAFPKLCKAGKHYTFEEIAAERHRYAPALSFTCLRLRERISLSQGLLIGWRKTPINTTLPQLTCPLLTIRVTPSLIPLCLTARWKDFVK